jgi:hypothetical protein
MSLDTDKFIVPDGAPGATQPMKSVTFGEALTLMGNGTLTWPKVGGNDGDVMTDDGAGNLSLQPKTAVNKFDINTSTVLVATAFELNIYEIDASGGPITITLPKISTVANKRYTFIKVDTSSNKITIDGDLAETINGELTNRIVAQFDSFVLFPNTDNWFLVSSTVNPKTLFVDRNGSGSQSIPTGTPTVVAFDNVIVDSGDYYDGVTNFDFQPGNAIFQIILGVEIEDLDTNNFIEVCLRKNGTNIACARIYSTTSNQEVSVRLSDIDSNVDPAPGTYDVTVEHNQGGNLNLLSDPVKTFWKINRVA